ncbi:flagellar hook-associated protein FlgK [Pigmentiphaga soli]|uniref:Flagellar hook-associated protein 1 n=1 Tax=Pigmentiphaga soli TaxID=1007095 RepID=A0ABP8GNW5_9BURK
MTTNIVNIALTGLKAAQAGLTVTANNISNQGTPGYSREELVQQASFSTFSGAGYFGQGVDVKAVRRAYSDFLTSQATQSASRLSYLSTYSDQMSSLMNRLGDVQTGINSSLNDLYGAFGDFSQHPDESASRGAALSAAQATAARFRSLGQDLATLKQGTNQQIGAAVDQVNSLVQSIASYNDKIGLAIASGGGQAPNDLLDQRDVLVRQLGQLTGISTSTQGSSINIFLSNGQPLVVGNTTSQLKFADDPSSPSGSSVWLVSGGHSVLMRESDIDGGQVGALLQFRDNELAQASSQLGRLAIGMASAYNQQQQFGLDAQGDPGGALFKIGAPQAWAGRANAGDAVLRVGVGDTRALTGDDYDLTRVDGDYVLTRAGSGEVVGTFDSLPQDVAGLHIELAGGEMEDGDTFHIDVTGSAASGMAVLLTDPQQLAAAAPMQIDTSAANTGTGAAGRLRSVAGGTPDYGTSVDLVFTSASAYELRATDGTVLGSGTLSPSSTTISLNGWALDFTGTPAAGDRFTISASPGDPSGDSRNAVALAALGTAKLVDGDTLTNRYAAVVSQVGTRAASINVAKSAQQSAYDQAIDAEQSTAGVNVDEEGARLIRYQQAYSAAGKVLSMASQLFDELITAMG